MRVFAGPNGSGKSSLFEFLQDSGKFKVEHFLNADILEKQLKEMGFKDSLTLLYDVIKSVRRAYIFDNSGKENRLVAEFYKGVLEKSESNKLPSWFQKYVIQKISF